MPHNTAVIDGYAANLRAISYSATPEEIRDGRAWYPIARGELYDIAREFGYSIKRVAFAAAALSNNMSWEHNVSLVRHVCSMLETGSKPRGHYAHCLNKAVAILRDGNFDALSGVKVVPFAHALLGTTHAAVIDRWMYRAAGIGNAWPTERRSNDIAIALRMVAKEERRSVSEAQAIIWLATQRVYGYKPEELSS